MADKRKGIAFQNFVGMIEKAFAVRDNVTVEVGKFITDVDSESRREFDVWIVSKFGGYHELVTAIEVKDEKTVIGVPDVEGFLSKCGRNNINQKVMVSSKGSNPAAEKLAAKTGVTLMTMAQAEAFDWITMDAFNEYRRHFHSTDFRVILAKGVATPEGEWELLDETGELVTRQMLMQTVHDAIPMGDFNVPDGPQTYGIELTNEFSMRTAGGEILPVSKVIGATTFTIEVVPRPLTLHRYTGSGAGEGTNLSFASGDMKIGEINGKLVFARQSDGSTDVSWQPNPADLKKPKRMPKAPSAKLPPNP